MADIVMSEGVRGSTGWNLEGGFVSPSPSSVIEATPSHSGTSFELAVPVASYGRSEGPRLRPGHLSRPAVGGSSVGSSVMPIVSMEGATEEGGRAVFFTNTPQADATEGDAETALVGGLVLGVLLIVGSLVVAFSH